MDSGTLIRGAVIVAGGSGQRMGGGIPKQFLPLGAAGKPVIVHTVERFLAAMPEGSPVVVVMAAGEMERWEAIAREWGVWDRVSTCEGGQMRFESVKNGLQAIECHMVAIHDAVRPLVSRALIGRVFGKAEKDDVAVPCVRPVDSFRTEDDMGHTHPCDRSALMAVQTPQAFSFNTIRKAYQMPCDPRFTDDASVWEAFGRRVHICEGELQNIKITTQADMIVAGAFIDAGY